MFPKEISVLVQKETYELSLTTWRQLRGKASICKNCVLAIALIENGHQANVGLSSKDGMDVFIPTVTDGEETQFYITDEVGNSIARSWETESHGYPREFNKFPAMVTFTRGDIYHANNTQ